MSEAPERIWLQSAEDAKHQCEGRMWCEDKVWPENADQHEPTEYVRADIAERQIAEMSERFRAVNIAEVIRQSGNDFVAQAERIAALEVERDRLAAELQGIAKRWPDSAAAKSARAALASVKE